MVEAPGLDAVRGDTAGDDATRAASLAAALDAKAAAVWFARGGYGAARLLPRLDLDRLAAGPVLLGYSDATALLWPVAARGGRTVLGPLVGTLGRGGVDPATSAALEALVFGPGRHRVAFDGRMIGRARRLEGPVFAGNLTVLASLVGTPWTPRARDAVVFLEDWNEATYRVDRALTQLLQGGVLDGAAGVVFGSFDGCAPSPPEGPAASLEEVFEDFAARSGLPVISGYPFGHAPSVGVLPLGGHVRVTPEAADLFLDPAGGVE